MQGYGTGRDQGSHQNNRTPFLFGAGEDKAEQGVLSRHWCPYTGLLRNGDVVFQQHAASVPIKSPKGAHGGFVPGCSAADVAFHSTFSFSNLQRVKVQMEALLLFGVTADEPPQRGDHPRAVHCCCGLAVHDRIFLSTLLILLLGTYLVPYSYPSHW